MAPKRTRTSENANSSQKREGSQKRDMRSGTITEILEAPTDDLIEGPMKPVKIDRHDEAYAKARHLNTIKQWGSKFVCDRTTRLLGIQANVDYIFEKLGWERLYKSPEPIFRSINREFLATYTCYFPEDNSIEDAYMEFRLNKKWVRLNMSQFADILGVPKGIHSLISTTSAYVFQEFWQKIAIQKYSSSADKISWIQHPAIRYAHQFMSNSIFARDEPDKIHRLEMGYLYLALQEFHDGLSLDGCVRGGWSPMDLASRVAIHLYNMANTKAKDVKICVGGIITKIARRVDTGIIFYKEDIIDGYDALG
ncbi:PREDICTED: uncharacterized protein LOC104820475 [Tarenaya hassleriana]|uniref:uncharacterized protein LOC104820475 n=1 Tax=Tarenaya hassleriana TaxID=28532 RepID=UPI00053C69EA|nr:PREDICTED: uncharacterized protein LOC104820475 [Tarenaya hassleriana]